MGSAAKEHTRPPTLSRFLLARNWRQLAHGTARRLARLWLLYPRIEVLTLKRFDKDTVHARWRVAGLARATQLGEVCWGKE